MKKIIILAFLGIVFSCNTKKETIEGELYFKEVNLLPNDGLSPQKVSETEDFLKKFNKTDNPNDMKMFEYFTLLKNNNLLGAPNIKVKANDGIKEIFLSQEEYEKVKKFNLSDLNSRHKKVILEFDVKNIDGSIFYSDKISSIKEVDGDTPWSK